jgi:hypothetical protein
MKTQITTATISIVTVTTSSAAAIFEGAHALND